MPVKISRDDAGAAGLKRFFSGVPCKHGHISERLVSCGVCVECNAIHNRKPKTRQQVKAYRAQNREVIRSKRG